MKFDIGSIFSGVEFPEIPETNGIPIVCDMSSNLLTRTFDVSKVNIFFLFYVLTL